MLHGGNHHETRAASTTESRNPLDDDDAVWLLPPTKQSSIISIILATEWMNESHAAATVLTLHWTEGRAGGRDHYCFVVLLLRMWSWWSNKKSNLFHDVDIVLVDNTSFCAAALPSIAAKSNDSDDDDDDNAPFSDDKKNMSSSRQQNHHQQQHRRHPHGHSDVSFYENSNPNILHPARPSLRSVCSVAPKLYCVIQMS